MEDSIFFTRGRKSSAKPLTSVSCFSVSVLIFLRFYLLLFLCRYFSRGKSDIVSRIPDSEPSIHSVHVDADRLRDVRSIFSRIICHSPKRWDQGLHIGLVQFDSATALAFAVFDPCGLIQIEGKRDLLKPAQSLQTAQEIPFVSDKHSMLSTGLTGDA